MAGYLRKPLPQVAYYPEEEEEGAEELADAMAEKRRKKHAEENKRKGPEHIYEREGFQYLSLRGSEDVSVMVGVRSNVAAKITLLHWAKIFNGTYKGKKRVRKNAYSRVLIAKVTLDDSVGFLRQEHNLCAVHVNNNLAQKNTTSFFFIRNFGRLCMIS